jgi:D-glycero-D-manno-heptose 1,7-bisphosphate phosphatase
VTLEAARAVILDRDGTIVVDRGYLDDPAQLQFLPGAAEGLRQLRAGGHRIVVLTNQSGVGRGRFPLTRLHEIHATLLEMVRQAGAEIDAIYYCPHRPEEDCSCRKPRPKLLLEAAAELGFEPSAAARDRRSDLAGGACGVAGKERPRCRSRRSHGRGELHNRDGRGSDRP